MKPTQIIVKDDSSFMKALDAVNSIELDAAKPVVVEVKPYTTKRKASQNALYWSWMTDCEKTRVNEFAGWASEDWHLYFKELFLVGNYCAWFEDVADLMSSVEMVFDRGLRHQAGAMNQFIIKNISTTRMNVKQFSEYLNDIQKWCGMNGVVLRTDHASFKQALGYK
jgi:hypothetical protein